MIQMKESRAQLMNDCLSGTLNAEVREYLFIADEIMLVRWANESNQI